MLHNIGLLVVPQTHRALSGLQASGWLFLAITPVAWLTPAPPLDLHLDSPPLHQMAFPDPAQNILLSFFKTLITLQLLV